jgi:hypothetical protein
MATTVLDWLALIRSEFLEIPGLHLTKPQVQRLWGIDTMTCDALLEALVDARFLRRTHTGAYARLDGGPVRANTSVPQRSFRTNWPDMRVPPAGASASPRPAAVQSHGHILGS